MVTKLESKSVLRRRQSTHSRLAQVHKIKAASGLFTNRDFHVVGVIVVYPVNVTYEKIN